MCASTRAFPSRSLSTHNLKHKNTQTDTRTRTPGCTPAPASPPRRKEMGAVFGGYSSTPCAVALFPKELYRPPRSWAASAYNIVQVGPQQHRRAELLYSKGGASRFPLVGRLIEPGRLWWRPSSRLPSRQTRGPASCPPASEAEVLWSNGSRSLGQRCTMHQPTPSNSRIRLISLRLGGQLTITS
jgi:hypothetical protein